MDYYKLNSQKHPRVILRVTPGHFAMSNAHVNYYLDTTPMKTRVSEAHSVAQAFAQAYYSTTIVDTIVCMDGMQVVGGFLADELTQAGIVSMNMHKSIYVLPLEYSAGGQIIFQENLVGWIKNRSVLLLLDSASSGRTIWKAVDALNYYGANITGVSAIFSAASKIAGKEVDALFTTADIPDYEFYNPEDCQMCKKAVPMTGIASSLGFTEIRQK